jgi:hypothetical protein
MNIHSSMNIQLKRRTRQAALLVLMATSVFGAIGSASAAELPSADTTTTAAAPAQAQPIMARSAAAFHPSLLMHPALERSYLKLLAGSYAPDSLAEWTGALEDRKQVENEMPKPAFKSISLRKEDAATLADPAGTITFKAVPAQAVPAGEAASATVRDRRVTVVQDGSGGGPAIQAVPVEAAAPGDIMVTRPFKGSITVSQVSKSFELQQKLADAVDREDAATIRSLLPDLLAEYKQETEQLRQWAAAIKEHADTAKLGQAE